MRISFSIFARVFRIEAPFLNEWLEHHLALGFETIYLCVAGQRENTAEERAFLESRIAAEFLPSIHWLESPDQRSVAAIYQQLGLRDLWHEDERVLTIDIDEFLVLRRHATIAEFYAAEGRNSDALFFEWVNFAAGDWSYPGIADQMRDAKPWVGVNGKTMARSGSVRKLKVHRHEHERDARCRDAGLENAFLAHLCSRGYADILCRTLYGSVKTNDDDLASMREMLLASELPNNLPRRLVLLHAQLLVSQSVEANPEYAECAPRLRHGGDQQTLDELVAGALASEAGERADCLRRARELARRYRIEFTDSESEIRELGGFVAMCNRLRLARLERVRDGDDKRVCYTVAIVPREVEDDREPLLTRWFGRLRRGR